MKFGSRFVFCFLEAWKTLCIQPKLLFGSCNEDQLDAILVKMICVLGNPLKEPLSTLWALSQYVWRYQPVRERVWVYLIVNPFAVSLLDETEEETKNNLVTKKLKIAQESVIKRRRCSDALAEQNEVLLVTNASWWRFFRNSQRVISPDARGGATEDS